VVVGTERLCIISTRIKKNKKSILVVVIGITLVTTSIAFSMLSQQAAEGRIQIAATRSEAPAAVSGNNIYIAWWTNKTANNNEEVMFRASNDAGATFSNKTNLSNSSDSDSWRVEIAGEGENVVVSWWETNQTSDTPVARVSNDGGQTFGPLLMLAANGTLGSGEAEEIAIAEEEGEG
jgi:hypothetical protein